MNKTIRVNLISKIYSVYNFGCNYYCFLLPRNSDSRLQKIIPPAMLEKYPNSNIVILFRINILEPDASTYDKIKTGYDVFLQDHLKQRGHTMEYKFDGEPYNKHYSNKIIKAWNATIGNQFSVFINEIN